MMGFKFFGMAVLSLSITLYAEFCAFGAQVEYKGFNAENFRFYPPNCLNKEGIVKYNATTDREWQCIMESSPNMIKNGGQYLLEFKAKILGGFDQNKKLEVVVRNRSSYKQWSDVALINRFGETDDWQPVSARFNVPNNKDKYALYFFAQKGANVEIKDFVLKEDNFVKNIDVAKGTQSEPAELGTLPTGAEDFKVDLPKPEKVLVVDAADFGMKEDSEANGSALNRAIAHCKKVGASKLVVKKGVYKFFENDVTIAFEKMKDFTFDGGGSTFIFRRTSINKSFWISGMTRFRIRNFNIDWDWETDPLAAVVKIVNSGRDAKKGDFFDAAFVEYENDAYPLFNKPTRVASMSPWDFENKTVGEEFGQEACYGFRGWDKGPKTQWLDKNLLRIYASLGTKKVDSYYRLQHFYYEGDCFMFGKCEHISFEKINIYSCRGAALYGISDNKYVQMSNVNIKPPVRSRRPITSTADHFYITCPKGFVKVVNCEFSFGGDDCFNIHGPVVFGKKIGDSKLNVLTPKGIEFFRAGATVELMDSNFAPFDKTLKVKNFTDKCNGTFEIEFDGKLPEERKGGFTLFNPEYCVGNAILKNCYFHDNRARGTLLLSRDITLENCRFKHNEMIGIRMETGYAIGIWSEGVFSRNIVVRNCTFESLNSTGTTVDGFECDITTGAYIRSYSSEQADYPVVENVLFENNTFKNTFGLIARIASAKNMIFKGNTFINTLPRKDEKDYRACFYLRDSSDVKIVDNTWVESPLVPAPRVMADSSVKNVVVAGNKIVPSEKIL